MDFHFTTAVWGPWHVDCFVRVAVPTLLAPRNLPAIAETASPRYRIFTTKVSRKRLEDHSVIGALERYARVEMAVIGDEDTISSNQHLAAWQTACDDARASKAIAVTIHPDVAWSDGSLANMARAFGAGKKAVILPNIRVISESFVPALVKQFQPVPHGPISVPGRDAVRLATQHLHPLSILSFADGPDACTATEVLWPVPGQGLLMRHASRPAIAADPSRCEVDTEFYIRDVADPDELYNMTNSDDMLMLSLAPLAKDIGLYELGQPMSPLNLALWALHPQNKTPLNVHYARQPIRLRYADGAEDDWQRAIAASDEFISQMLVCYRLLPLVRFLHDHGCRRASQILAMALQECNLARLRLPDGKLLFFSPTDEALAACRSVEAQLREGAEERLIEALKAHIAPVGPHAMPNATVHALAGNTISLEGDTINGEIPITARLAHEDIEILAIGGALCP